MKIIFLVSVIICNIYPKYEILDSAPVELFVLTLSSSETDTFRYSITAIGSVWKADNTHPPSNYTMTSDFNRVIYPPYDNPPLSRTDWNACEDWAGYDFIIGSQAIPPPWPYRMPNFAWGLYKIKMLYGDDYFYLNYRDQNYSQYSSYCNGHCADVWVKYDSDQDMFSFVTQSNTDPYSSDWVDASGGKLFFIWEIKNQWPSTSNFPDYWQNCLVLIPTSDNHPQLVWGPYPENVDLVGYRIYKKVGNSNFYIRKTILDEECFSFIDDSVGISQIAGTEIKYYVKAMYTMEEESSPTNEVVTNIKNQSSEKISNKELKEYQLYQNHPNPFNPVTNIKWQSPVDGWQTLKVFDILGNEVVTLVNEFKPAGENEIEFDGSNLPSGVYFYQLQGGDPSTGSGQVYLETKKMILMK